MKVRIFLVTLTGFILILAMAIVAVIYELSSVRDINMNNVTDKLYSENSRIMSSIISSIPPSSYDKVSVPPSWAEVMTVDSTNLTIIDSTNKASRGKYFYSLPPLLEQSKDIIKSIKSSKPSVVPLKDYMIVIVPYEPNRCIIGLKQKKWEYDLISSQLGEISRSSGAIYRNLVIFAIAGMMLSIIFAFMISTLMSGFISGMFKSLEQLSLGDFDAKPVSGKDRNLITYRDSFIRLKTSLKFSIEKLRAK